MDQTAPNPEILEKNVDRAEALLTLLANRNRLLALCKLVVDGEMSVSALADAIGLSQSALSQHLAKLRAGGLVSTRRDGQTIYYSITSSDARLLIKTLYDIYCAEALAD